MAKKVIASTIPSYLSSPCDRCGKPKIIGKVWEETIETFNGKSTIEHTQIVCSDSSCQKEYDKKLLDEAKKREALKLGNESITKKTLVFQSPKTRNVKTKT